MQATSCPRIREAEQPNCESFKLLPCLWDKVQQNCPQEETHELKKIIGDSLVEESCDLYTEVRHNHMTSDKIAIFHFFSGKHITGHLSTDVS